MQAPHGLRAGAAGSRAPWAGLLVCALLGAGLLLAPAGALAARLQAHMRVGAAPRYPRGARTLGALGGSTQIAAVVTLSPRDPSALAAYASSVSEPGSSDYRHYLTVSEFRERFGPSAASVAAVRSALLAQGLTPGPTSANGLSIPLTASAANIGHAFSLSFEDVRLRSGRIAYANTAAPQFPASVAGAVQGVVGLNTLTQAQPLGLIRTRSIDWGLEPGLRLDAADALTPRVVTGGPQPCSTASDDAPADSAYTADQLASAYGFSSLYSSGDLGGGQTVALLELERNSTSDISAYQSCYGTDATVNYIKEDGGATGTRSGSGEAALDIEDVIGLAPDATIDVYQAPNTNAGLLDDYTAIVESGANVVSTSWGECEAAEAGTDLASSEATLFEEAATQGQSVFAAAGDSGSEDCADQTGSDSLAVDDPASQPYVTGVGGTSLPTLGPPPTQTVWSDQCSDGPCGGGGGVSTAWPMPSYQLDAPSSLNVISSESSGSQCGAAVGSYCREVPDVSADADPGTGYLIYYAGSWGGIGGTSAAAPLWAAFIALVNASSYCAGSDVGFANAALYKAAATDYAADFDDITSGNNDITQTNGGLYPAGAGYDMASGLGTPVGSALPQQLCDASTVPTVTVSDPGTQTGLVGDGVSLQISATDSASATLTYSASGLPAGLSINRSSGLISGTLTTPSSGTVAVNATDAEGGSGATTFAWTVTSRSSSTAVSCAPASVTAGAATSCTATVTDTSPGTPVTPGGTVDFTSPASSQGTYSDSGSCTLSPTSTAGTAACTLSYTPAAGTHGSQSVVAAFLGNSAHSASSSPGFTLTVTSAPSSTKSPSGGGTSSRVAPSDATPPTVSGRAAAGHTLTCHAGTWSGSPTSFDYAWSRNRTAIAGAGASSYTVRTADEGAALRCVVVAVNGAGMSRPATSAAVSVAVPRVAGCPAASGALSGTTLGFIKLGLTRAQARARYHDNSRRSTAASDTFCLTPAGITAGYATPKLVQPLAKPLRAALAGRVVWLSTANAYYSLDGVAPGATLAAAEHLLPHGTLLTVGSDRWYVVRAGAARAALEVRGGLVALLAIADLQLTASTGADRALITTVG